MEADFWHRRWRKNEIGFHEKDGSHWLKTFFHTLSLPLGARVFVPLCGKTRDIAWLLSKGFSVVAIELSTQAVDQLFTDLDVHPAQNSIGVFEHRSTVFSNGLQLDVLIGDFFALDQATLGKVQAVFDRAALVALPAKMRKRYTEHLLNITNQCPQLLICYEYAEGIMQGPPHSVNNSEVEAHYCKNMSVLKLHKGKVEGGFRGQSEVYDAVYLLGAK